jgi:hypothetical protein
MEGYAQQWNCGDLIYLVRILSKYCRKAVGIQHICRDAAKICFADSRTALGLAGKSRPHAPARRLVNGIPARGQHGSRPGL